MRPTLLALLAACSAACALDGARPAERDHGLQSIAHQPAGAAELPRTPDAPFVPTRHEVVAEMLRVADVGPGDVVYDLGCGDGRIVIAASERGARGIGVDIDPHRVRESQQNAATAGVSDRVEFRQQDLFEADLREATVVTLYLLSSVNLRLRPKLLNELRPGTRIVSHNFTMGDWRPERTVPVGGHTVYLWTVPEGGIRQMTDRHGGDTRPR